MMTVTPESEEERENAIYDILDSYRGGGTRPTALAKLIMLGVEANEAVGLLDEIEQDDDVDYGGAEEDDDRLQFADSGGRSALRAETDDNPRNLPCPNCGAQNVLTPADRAQGYQCDRCADAAEGFGP